MNDQNIYIEQLRDLFDSYDVAETGYLSVKDIRLLCNQLQLPEPTLNELMNILEEKSDGEVSFPLFKDSFITLLIQSSSVNDDLEEDAFQTEDSEREVAPKFTIGTKQYGRRSRPGSMIENDNNDEESGEDDNGADEVAVSQQPSSPLYAIQGQPESLGSPETFLQALWEKIGIERKDSLNIGELAVVCGHIGMDMSEDMVVQLFEKLDCDHDGRVTFDELLQCLFHHADSSKPLSETSFSCSPQNHATYQRSPKEDETDHIWESGIFSTIDPDSVGYASVSAVVAFWESLGISCGARILHDLGFGKAATINLQNLSLVLEEELVASSPDPTYQVALTTLQKEIRTLRARCNHLQEERDKLRTAVVEANERAALLAQEIDEHHSRLEATSQTQLIGLERRHQEQLREMEEENRSERDLLAAQAGALRQKLEGKLQDAQESEANALREVAALRIENQRIEKELSETNERRSQAELLSVNLQKEVDSLCEFRRQMVEIQSGETDRRCDALKLELEELHRQNKDLQDHINEMSLQMESMKLHMTSCRTTPSSARRQPNNRTNSWLADYNKACDGSNLKRRGSGSSSESNSEEEESSRTSGKIRRKYSGESSVCSEIKESFGPFLGGQIPEEEMELDPKSEQGGEHLYQLLQPFLATGQGVADQSTHSDELLKELYVENARLMRELQLAEEQHHRAEQCNVRLQFKCKVLGKLLADVTHVSAS